MSVINKMLQELDRRNAVPMGAAPAAARAVKPVPFARTRSEWFWRVLAALVLISVTWVAWVAYQLQPRTFVTPLTLKVSEQPRKAVVVRPIVAAPVPVEVVSETRKVEPPAEGFKLARSLETPIVEPKPKPVRPEARKAAADPQPKAVVDKRERTKTMMDTAEARFRRAVMLLNQARISEAEEQLAAALQADASHVPARQAYVALLLEQQRVQGALRLLREAVEANPQQPVFSLGLARVYAEQRNYPEALAVLDKAGPVAEGAEFQALRGAVLQRLGRHAEAVVAYQAALQKSAQPGGTWTGLAISLEALGRHAEASEAYQRALGAGALPAELREYAEARIRALQ